MSLSLPKTQDFPASEPIPSAQSPKLPGLREKLLSRQTAITVALLCFFTALLFLPSLKGEFLNWDDRDNFVDNKNFHGLSLQNIGWALKSKTLEVYQPLSWIALEGEYSLFGLRTKGYHAVSILLHSANVALLFFLTYLLLCAAKPVPPGSRWRVSLASAAAALLFGVHPLRTEAVSWISCQPYLLCSLFFMASLCSYIRYCRSPYPASRKWLAITLVAVLFAMLSKAVAVTVPVALVLLDFYPFRRLSGNPGRWLKSPERNVWLEKVPFLFLSTIFMFLAIWARGIDPLGKSPFSLTARFLQSCYGLTFFLVKTLLPRGLSGFYGIPKEQIILHSPVFIAAAVAVLVIFGALFAFRKRLQPVWLAWLCYVAILFPNLGLINFSAGLTSDRYGYIACLVWFVLVAYALGVFLQKSQSRSSLVVFALGVLAISTTFARLTFRQQRIWRNSEIFWTNAWIHGGQDDFVVNHNMAMVLAGFGKNQVALSYFKRAVENGGGDNFLVNRNYAMALAAAGNSGEAMTYLKRSLALSTATDQQLVVLNRMATLIAEMGRAQDAIPWLIRALKVKADDAITRNNLGVVFDKLGFIDDAAAQFREAQRIDPSYEDAHHNLQNVVMRQMGLDMQIQSLSAELKKKPRDLDRHMRLGIAFGLRGKFDDAIVEFQKALKLRKKLEPAERYLAKANDLKNRERSLPAAIRPQAK